MAATIQNDKGLAPPKKGEKYVCEQCGMALQITADCRCKESNHVHFHCCDQEMKKV